MPTLRLNQTSEGGGAYLIEVSLEGDNLHRSYSVSGCSFTLPEQDHEDLRWYLEDYLEHPFDPAPIIANRIERRITEIGGELFDSIFRANEDAREVWKEVAGRLDATRVEVVTPIGETTTVPWELLFDPEAGTHLALQCQSFVRVASNVNGRAEGEQLPANNKRSAPDVMPSPANAGGCFSLSESTSAPVRILLIISRPIDSGEVPFRSVASRLLKSLHGRPGFELDVLRPPTFARLNDRLRESQAEGRPYHVVHFDGHGVYEDLQASLLKRPPKKRRGYLLFENVEDHKGEPIHGTLLGRSLAQAGAPLLLLNACRSAQAEASAEPGKGVTENHPRAFGSLAQEVVEAGVPGVVAMRYNVYVVTAARFVADLYTALARGLTLGEAVTQGRKELYRHAERELVYVSRELQDWSVPVVFETKPVAILANAAAEGEESRDDSPPATVTAAPRGEVPAPSDTGFIGRDETLLDLERAFNTEQITLLHAYAGSGKTTAAAEFARWYELTGGVDGPILLTSFERYTPLVRVLDAVERAFSERLKREGVDWLALDDASRRDKALQVLGEVSTLWVWDNVESIAGFPSGVPSEWSAAEQRELAEFLREARHTKAKFLLTSRRDDHEWLHGLAVWHILLPPMPMLERVQMLRSLAEKHGRPPVNILDWLPLLEYTQGNPLTIIVVVGQALRDRLDTKEQLDAFVARLRAGEAAFDDEQSEGRSKSLGASLSYGFAHAFNADELRILALLALFQSYVDVTDLYWMGHPEIGDLPQLRDLSREARISLLNRAANVGLLTACVGSVEGVVYAIHPALPWFFRKLFDEHYPAGVDGEGEDLRLRAMRAYAAAIGATGVYYHKLYYDEGQVDVIDPLAAAEANLHHAWKLSRANGWWTTVISTMQGLDTLYSHTGRRAEWERMVKEVVPDFIEPSTNRPLPGREAEWNKVIEYQVDSAMRARRWAEAEGLQLVRVKWERERVAPLLGVPPGKLDKFQRRAVQSLAVSLSWLGDIELRLGKTECVSLYQEAVELYRRLGETRNEASAASKLGDVYKELPALRDLEQAEHWYQYGLQLLDRRDHLGRSRRLADLGLLAYERFNEALKADRAEEEMRPHLEAAAQHYEKALHELGLLPTEAVGDLAAAHNQLGVIYDTLAGLGDFARALSHYQEAIRFLEQQGNLYDAASARFNVAIALHGEGQYAKALLYAQAALKNYQADGEQAAAEIERTRQAINRIEQDLKAEGDKTYEHV